jgi:hypothetical protein
MSQAVVGRIFWKEVRVQRAFWLWILLLGIFIQWLPMVFGRDWYRSANAVGWFYSVKVIIACSFAVGSAAIAFAGETENRTRPLFQRLPVGAVDLLVGKLGWSLLGTYALIAVLAVTASLLGTPLAESLNNQRGRAWLDFEPGTIELLVALSLPLPFLAISMFCSLMFRDVLTTVAVGGAATAILTGAIGTEHWLAIALAVVVAAVVDVLLVPHWLTDSVGSTLALRLPRLPWPRAAANHSTLSVRSSIAWRRAAGSLLWKEWRQSIVLALTLTGVAALVTLGRVAIGALTHLTIVTTLVSVCFTILPLIFGIAAGRADRRDRAYQLLANRGVSPNAYWTAKHAVWMGLALMTALLALGFERLTLHLDTPLARHTPATLWDFCGKTANVTFFGGWGGSAGFAATLAVAVFAVALLYALGHLLSVVIPSAMTALVLGLIAWAFTAQAWVAVTFLEIPFWWTIGLLPLIFLFAGWLRTRDWLVDRNTLPAWGRVAASVVVPLFGICCAVAVFRVVQIPSVTLPLELQATPTQQPVTVSPLRQSLFVEAVKSLTAPPTGTSWDPNKNVRTEGWQYADRQTRGWVAQNKPARKLALLATQHERGDFPAAPWSLSPGSFSGEGVADLRELLLDSARKLESERWKTTSPSPA